MFSPIQTLYVFQLVMDGLSGQASLTSVTEYLLTQPILSFVIAGHAPCPTTGEVGGGGGGGGESGEEGEGGRTELAERAAMDSRLVTVLIKLFCVHTRCATVVIMYSRTSDNGHSEYVEHNRKNLSIKDTLWVPSL